MASGAWRRAARTTAGRETAESGEAAATGFFGSTSPSARPSAFVWMENGAGGEPHAIYIRGRSLVLARKANRDKRSYLDPA